jgi:serine/threonine-protein kinase
VSPLSGPPAASSCAGPIPSRGALLGGIYRILGQLGEGAMGVILLAQDEQLEREVAIKLLRPEQLDNHAMQRRLLQEARAMARVHHPNVVEIHAFGEHAGAPYFVMQYVPGATLDEYVQRRGRLDLDETLSILEQVCHGITAIHASGIAHRDLKPSNILVGSALRVVVADLGLARKVSTTGPADISFSGTPAYLAPEVVLGRQLPRELLPRVDVYALGLIAYLLLTGRIPFHGGNTFDLMKWHLYDRPLPPSELCPDLPPSFDAPLLSCLTKDPEHRMESAEALREALLAARDEAVLSRRSLRVLVADDDPAFRALLTDILSMSLPGARIEAVANGSEALEAVKARPPALGVFDLDMPGLDGVTLTAQIRALPQGGDFPIIVATGAGGASEWRRLARLGASAFLVKPFDAGQLMTLARGLVGATAATRETMP